MTTENWIERVIVQELARPNEREKYDYQTRTRRTGEFEWACAKLGKEIAALNGEVAQYDMWDAIDSEYHEAVAEALDNLQERSLITEVKTMPSDREHHDEESVWELTEDGLRTVQRLNDEWLRETVLLAKEYGRVPDT